MNDLVDVAWKVAAALEAAGVAYYLGGSVASSLQATARSTQDIDFVVDLKPSQVCLLSESLGDEFSVDDEALKEACVKNSSWNIFHLPTGLKIDFLMLKDTPYDAMAFSRRKRFRIDFDIDPYLKSVEDSIIKKLQWYVMGGRVSSTQWRDVVELIRVNHATLDGAYIEKWVLHLRLASEWQTARQEALEPQ